MMIGPSAPNGPPDPIEIADEIGFSSATFGSTLLPLIRIASIASGMPCPRVRSDPYRAINPIISAPPSGTNTLTHPGGPPSGATRPVPQTPPPTPNPPSTRGPAQNPQRHPDDARPSPVRISFRFFCSTVLTS